MSFSVGDLIIYGETGVCRVEDIVERPFLDENLACYKLMPLYQSCVIYTPVDKSNVFMRGIISAEEAQAIIDGIKETEPMPLPQGSPRALSDQYDKIIKLHDCRALASLIVSVYAKRQRLLAQKKKLSAIDERYTKKAEELLLGELAAALGIEKNGVRALITEDVNI